MTKNGFHFTLKAHFAVKILRFFSWLFCSFIKTDWKDEVNFKIYGVTALIVQYLKK